LAIDDLIVDSERRQETEGLELLYLNTVGALEASLEELHACRLSFVRPAVRLLFP
jgi:hypothetical protein